MKNNFNQLDIFTIGKEQIKINKPIRLIELFARQDTEVKHYL